MNKKYRISLLSMFVLSLVGFMTFNACSNSDDEFSTEQYKGGISLNVFGPCPVARGGELRFLGSGMTEVTSIELPGCDEIKDIKNVSSQDIRITVPQTAEVGYVTLNTPKGKIVTKTQITYSEPISIKDFSPKTAKAGDVITITGDYLNLIKEVIFADKVSVYSSDFISHSRSEIKVAVPVGAQTGKIIISDAAPDIPNWIYTSQPIDITLPTCTSVSPEKLKAGKTITFKGTDLNLIKGVAFNGAENYSVKIGEKNETLTCNLPEEATDGEVKLICYSGIKIKAGTIETVVPTSMSIASAIIKAGSTLLIKGTDMDLVKSVSLPNVTDAIEITATANEVTIKSIPDVAQSGDVTLNLLNGKYVTVPYTLIVPKVTSFSPSTIMAGNSTTIKGTNLDLVASVSFKGDGNPTVTEFKSQTATSIELDVPSAAEQGTIVLTLKNGDEVNVESGLTIKPATDPVIATMPETSCPGHYVLITGKNLNTVEYFYLGTTKITGFEERSATRVEFKVPSDLAYGDYLINMTNFAGEKFASEKTLKVQSPEYTITMDTGEFSFPFNLGGWSGAFRIYRDKPTDFSKLDIKIGSTLYLYVNATADFSQIQINNANWAQVALPQLSAPGEAKIAVPVDAAMLDALLNTQDGWSTTALVCQGEGMIVSKVTILP